MTKVTNVTNRQYKARLFEMIFSQPDTCLQLYNAVNGTDYDDPGLLEINTLENAIYMSMHNDLSFIIDSRLSLYEHQSTCSPNLPVRQLMYVADLYSVILRNANIYGTKICRIPTPHFLVFYNGEKEMPEEETLLLSNAYEVQEEHPRLELSVRVLNINKGYNEEMKKACKALSDYTEFTSRVRDLAKELPIEEAVEKAATTCIQDGILAEFLSKNRSEASKVSIYEYNEEKVMQLMQEGAREEGLEEGRAEGLKEGRKKGLEEGRKKGLEEGRKEGLAEGRKKGLEEGRKEGLAEGWKEGLEEGRKEGLEEGWGKGQEERQEEGQEEIRIGIFKKMILLHYPREEAQEISELTDEQAENVLGVLEGM